jgi:SAM-dependent methyltransferase
MGMKKRVDQHPRQIFSEWYRATPLGQALKRLESCYVLSQSKLTYNQIALQVGYLDEGMNPTPVHSPLLCVLTSNQMMSVDGSVVPMVAHPEELPIATQSVESLYLLHVLEFSTEPHQILRECERVLKPEGEVHILALNPWNPKGFLHCISTLRENKQIRLISAARLLDWLRLLNLDAQLVVGFSLKPERCIANKGSIWTRSRVRLATAFAVCAKKRRLCRIPPTPGWCPVPELIG